MVPFAAHESPRYVWMMPREIVSNYSESMCISDSLAIFFNICHCQLCSFDQNVHLTKFGGALVDIRGNAVITAAHPITGEDINVLFTLEMDLPQIMMEYRKQQLRYF